MGHEYYINHLRFDALDLLHNLLINAALVQELDKCLPWIYRTNHCFARFDPSSVTQLDSFGNSIFHNNPYDLATCLNNHAEGDSYPFKSSPEVSCPAFNYLPSSFEEGEIFPHVSARIRSFNRHRSNRHHAHETSL